MPTQALVLFSGGQDSTTCLAQALEDHPGGVDAIFFDYGQRHRVELDQARIICQLASVPLQIIDMNLLSQLTESALTRPDQPINHQPDQLPNTFVPGRNLVFLTLAAIVAYQKKVKTLYTGVCQTDYSGYPDCRDDFVRSAEHTIRLALTYDLAIKTPLMWLTKSETVKLMQKLGKIEWYAYTHTCYEGRRPACGVCPACKLRIEGFRQAGIPDPLPYAIPTNWSTTL